MGRSSAAIGAANGRCDAGEGQLERDADGTRAEEPDDAQSGQPSRAEDGRMETGADVTDRSAGDPAGAQPNVTKKGGRPRRPRKRKRGSVLIAIGLLLILAAAGLAAYNMWDSARAGNAADDLLQGLNTATVDDSAVASEPDGGGGSSDSMPTKTVNGYACIGVLSVPSLNIELPVLGDWDYARLRVAPCRYSGSYQTNDLVVCAHNYARHFGPLRNVAIGTDVYFTSVDGQRIHYIVGNRETLQPTAVEAMVENDHNSEAANDWDLTLFTCDLDGRTRCAVRCIRQ